MNVYGRSIRIAVLIGLLTGVPLSSVYAFRWEAAKAHQEMVANMAAFSEEVGSKAVPRDSLLTQREMKHIRWCASQHPSYHATDNSILGQRGNRQQCVSPVWDMADTATWGIVQAKSKGAVSSLVRQKGSH